MTAAIDSLLPRGTRTDEAVAIRLRVLNRFELTHDDRVVELPMSSRRTFAFIALRGRPVMRAYVAGTLWPEASEKRASASLRSSLWRLRQPGVRLVHASGPELRLNPSVVIDLRDGIDVARRLLDGAAISVEGTARASELLSEDVLPDWYDEWVIIQRERYRQLRLHALESLCDQLVAHRRMAEAVEAALCAIAGEPLRESAHRCLIRVHLAEGNRGEALRQYELCRRLLHKELDVEPSAQMEDLRTQISPR